MIQTVTTDLHHTQQRFCAVASLGWLTPGVATKGITPLFFS